MKTNLYLVILIALPDCSAVGGEEPDPAKLVRDLGSARFAARETAEQKLIALGPKAKAAVLAGTKDADSEVARRCEAIVPKILVAEGKALAEGTVDWPAPAGTRFKELVGDTKEARKLFALMTGDEHRAEVANTTADNPAQAAKLYAAELNRLMEAEARAVRAYLRQPADYRKKVSFADVHREAISQGDVALALYLGTLSPSDAAAEPSSSVSAMPRASFFELAAGPLREPIGRLFTAWLDRRHDPSAAQNGMEAALFADVDWANGSARRWATNKSSRGDAVGTALVVLGHHGNKDDLAKLSALREDHRRYRLSEDTRRPGVQLEIQVLDVAAAMSLRLRSQKLESHGFSPKLNKTSWGRPDLAQYVTPAAFASEEERAAALKKAWDWLDQQPGAPPKPARSGR